jgi:hypothetical protein
MKHPGRPLNVHTDACLCGSGRLLRDCCLTARCDTVPAGTSTGHSHPACFARSLNDCSRTISKEHYISKSVLGLFGSADATVSGMPWLPDGDEKKVSIESLTAKILCIRHNNALSPLDAVAAEFFRFFTEAWSDPGTEVYLTCGFELERWLLKMLCGLVVSGNATLAGQRLPIWMPPTEWLQILFGTENVESPAGLHSIIGRYRAPNASLNVNPVFKSSTGQPIALAFAVSGIAFLFAMEALPDLAKPARWGADTRYRPMVLQLTNGDKTREAHFGWPDGPLVSLSLVDVSV